MTKAAQQFLDILEQKDYSHLPIMEKEGRTVIPLGFNLGNANFKVYVDFPEDNHVALRVIGFITIKEDQFAPILLACNDLNKRFRWVKFYVDDDLDVNIEDDAIVDDITGGAEVFELVMRMAGIAEDAFPVFMKALYA